MLRYRFLGIAAVIGILVGCGSDSSDNRLVAEENAGEDAGGKPDATDSDLLTDSSAGDSDPSCDQGPGYLSAVAAKDALAIIVTSDAMAPSFAKLARLHTLTGIPTELVTIETICAGGCKNTDPKADTSKAIKDYLIGKKGLKYAILGGDIEVVPARKVHDSYKNPFMTSYTYEEDFYTDYYYSDFSVWDSNNDGIYAQDATDAPDYLPEISVSRIPVSTQAEAELYLKKVIHHLTQYDLKAVKKTALLSNVASKFSGFGIDGAFYFEAQGKTLTLLAPDSTVTKLYATQLPDSQAQIITVPGEIEQFKSGTNLIVHSGHGGVNSLTIELEGSKELSAQQAYALENQNLPIFLSCACEAGTFAAPYGSYKTDSAGEMLVNAPKGGAIAYLGNTAIGLGIAGGMQLIDELLRYVQSTENPLLADAYFAAHQKMPDKDTFTAPIVNIPVPVVDRASYEWTQKAVVLLGDSLIPVYKGQLEAAPTMSLKRTSLCEGTLLRIEFSKKSKGSLRLEADGQRYEVAVDGATAEIALKGNAKSVIAAFVASGLLASYQEF